MKKVKSWKDITIKQYKELIEIARDDYEDFEREVKILACVYDVDDDEIYNSNIGYIQELKGNLDFLNDLPKAENKKFDTIKIGDDVYRVMVNMNDFTYAQYVDFQNYWKEESNIGKVLSVLLIPEGKKYCEDYDGLELIKTIENSINIVDAQSICFFFLKSLQSSIKTTLKYLEKIAKGKKMVTMSKEKRMEIERQIQKVKEFNSMLG